MHGENMKLKCVNWKIASVGYG